MNCYWSGKTIHSGSVKRDVELKIGVYGLRQRDLTSHQ
jgi:hypothetical protein